MADLILEARGVWKSYRGERRGEKRRRPALIDTSIALRRGEILGVVGESGSGKTTLARCLALLVRPDQGTILCEGEDLTALSNRDLRHRRRRIQTVFQDPFSSLNPRISVGDAIGEVLAVHHLVPAHGIDARIAELLNLVGLPRSSVTRYPKDFSGGQRQRICIARALAAQPDVIIADEPFSALDVSIRAQIINLLLELRDALGLSMVFIGHDLFVVHFLANRIAVMLGGQIIEILPPSATLAAAMHPYTRELIAAAPTLENARAEMSAAGAVAGVTPPVIGCPYLNRCPLRTDTRCGHEYPVLRTVADQHWAASFCDLRAGRATS
jgi:oligopeptide/dipeptide ABC transporter ATP-binding protein